MTTEEVMREYEIGSEDIAAALAYAADLVEAHEFHPLPSWQGQVMWFLIDENLLGR